jgi:hypothetical protein
VRRFAVRLIAPGVVAASVVALGVFARAQGRVLTGYSPAASQVELGWEQKIRAIPLERMGVIGNLTTQIGNARAKLR